MSDLTDTIAEPPAPVLVPARYAGTVVNAQCMKIVKMLRGMSDSDDCMRHHAAHRDYKFMWSPHDGELQIRDLANQLLFHSSRNGRNIDKNEVDPMELEKIVLELEGK